MNSSTLNENSSDTDRSNDPVKRNKFISLSQDINKTTSIRHTFLGFTAIFSQLYRDKVSLKTKPALAHKKKNGGRLGRYSQFGFDSDFESKLHQNASEQMTISMIRKLRAERFCCSRIAEKRELEHIKTKIGLRKWSPKVIRSTFLRNTR